MLNTFFQNSKIPVQLRCESEKETLNNRNVTGLEYWKSIYFIYIIIIILYYIINNLCLFKKFQNHLEKNWSNWKNHGDQQL